MADILIAAAIAGIGLAYVAWSITHPNGNDYSKSLEVALIKRAISRWKPAIKGIET